MVEREDVELAVVAETHVDRPSRIRFRYSVQSNPGYGAAVMEHRFTGPSFTIGIEEELMILDAESLELTNAIESLLHDVPAGEIKPELMESVLEIATEPCTDTA